MGRQGLAAVLAPLAVLAVVVAATSAVVGFVREGGQGADGPDPTGPAASAPTDAVPDGFVRVADEAGGAAYLLPDDGAWRVREPDERIGVASGGEPAVSAAGTFGEGSCPGDAAEAPTAFVGFVEPRDAAGTTPQETAAEVARTWAGAARDGRDGDGEAPTLAPVRLDDGTAAWTAAVVVEDPAGPCPAAPALEVRSLSLLVGEQVTTVVLARGTEPDGGDLAGSLDAAATDEVLRSVTSG